MLLPNLPEYVDKEAFLAALQSLGIPSQGERLRSVLYEAGCLTLNYVRVSDEGRTLAAGTHVADITVKIGIRSKPSETGTSVYLDGQKIASLVKKMGGANA